MRQKQTKTKYQALKAVVSIAVILFAISFYPLIRKAIKNAWKRQKLNDFRQFLIVC